MGRWLPNRNSAPEASRGGSQEETTFSLKMFPHRDFSVSGLSLHSPVESRKSTVYETRKPSWSLVPTQWHEAKSLRKEQSLDSLPHVLVRRVNETLKWNWSVNYRAPRTRQAGDSGRTSISVEHTWELPSEKNREVKGQGIKRITHHGTVIRYIMTLPSCRWQGGCLTLVPLYS